VVREPSSIVGLSSTNIINVVLQSKGAEQQLDSVAEKKPKKLVKEVKPLPSKKKK
jgi:hypothetical protein